MQYKFGIFELQLFFRLSLFPQNQNSQLNVKAPHDDQNLLLKVIEYTKVTWYALRKLVMMSQRIFLFNDISTKKMQHSDFWEMPTNFYFKLCTFEIEIKTLYIELTKKMGNLETIQHKAPLWVLEKEYRLKYGLSYQRYLLPICE